MSRKNWSSEKIFSRVLNNKTRNTYWANIYELRRRPSSDVFNRALDLANSTNEKEKIVGIDVLAQLGFDPRFNEKTAVELFFTLLDEESPKPKVLDTILSAISHNNANLNETQISKLITFKNHRYSDVRFSLALALSGLQNESAIDTLIELSRDKHPEVRNWATFSIGSQIEINNKKIVDALWTRINDDHKETRIEAISGLAIRKDSRIKEILHAELIGINEHGSWILESIEKLKDKDFISLLEDQIEKNKKLKSVNEEWLRACTETLKSHT